MPDSSQVHSSYEGQPPGSEILIVYKEKLISPLPSP